jgi:hypothetical protein
MRGRRGREIEVWSANSVGLGLGEFVPATRPRFTGAEIPTQATVLNNPDKRFRVVAYFPKPADPVNFK